LSKALESIGFKAQCRSQLKEKIREREEGHLQSLLLHEVASDKEPFGEFDKIAAGCAMNMGGECDCGIDCICFGCKKHAKHQAFVKKHIRCAETCGAECTCEECMCVGCLKHQDHTPKKF